VECYILLYVVSNCVITVVVYGVYMGRIYVLLHQLLDNIGNNILLKYHIISIWTQKCHFHNLPKGSYYGWVNMMTSSTRNYPNAGAPKFLRPPMRMSVSVN